MMGLLMLLGTTLYGQGVVDNGLDEALKEANHFTCDLDGSKIEVTKTQKHILLFNHPSAPLGLNILNLSQSNLGTLVSGHVQSIQDTSITLGLLLPYTLVKENGETLRVQAHNFRHSSPNHPFFGAPQGPRVHGTTTLTPIMCDASYQELSLPADAIRIKSAVLNSVESPMLPPVVSHSLSLEIVAESTGCTTKSDFRIRVIEDNFKQHLSILRVSPDLCDGPRSEVVLNYTIFPIASAVPFYYDGKKVDTKS